MVRVSFPAKLRPWSELAAKLVMGVVPGLVSDGHRNRKSQKSLRFRCAKFFNSRDPPVLKILRRVNSVQAVNFGTAIRKHYGECPEMLLFPRKTSRKMALSVKKYGRSKILRVRAP